MNESSVVIASGLTKSYGPRAGVYDLDLEMPAGRIIGLIGPSGSGKTVTVRLMTGVLHPDSGWIKVLGENPTHFLRNTRARIGYMPQHSVLIPDLSLRQNLVFAASLYGMPQRRRDRFRELIEFVELDEAIDRLPMQASGGERRRLSLAAALIHQPDLLFLDEPTAGIDPVLRRKFWDRFAYLRDQGRSLVVTTQYVGEAAYCDLVAVLATGRVLTIDTPEGLRRGAFGGDLVEVVFARHPADEDIASLERVANGSSMQWIRAGHVRMTVDEGGSAVTAITRWAVERGLELEKAEVFLPSFDDVFVELVTKLDDTKEGAAPHVA